ncbi:MAG: exodeoxyribonuclease V subunit alpha [Planctomycetes bacterium]|nr:exodeoxyribonuclease V subunit alpha [Planctomycetota bacterium]
MIFGDYFPFLKEIFPTAGPGLQRLLQGGFENANLLRSDFYTMRDWLEIAAYGDVEEAHALLLLLLMSLEEGSLCIELNETALQRRLADLVTPEEAADWARRIVAAPAFPELIGLSPDDHRPVILHVVDNRRYLYFQKYLRAEIEFQRELKNRLNSSVQAAGSWQQMIDEVLTSQPLQLDRDQQAALAVALGNNFAIISGGPGTGKTSIVLTLLRCLIRGGIAPERIALAAPTGRAAQRLTDALRAGLERLAAGEADARLRDLSATTLHALLGYRPSRHLFTRHVENPIPADVVIVDEVSMVGLVLMSRLMEALAPTTKLILLGDKDQLPSVEAGAVLAHLAPDATEVQSPLRDRVVLLKTNHRSEQRIREAAQAINRQDITLIDRLPIVSPHAFDTLEADGGCWLLEQTQATAAELRGFLQHWAEQAFFRSRLEDATLGALIEAAVLDERDEDAGRLHPLFALMDRFRLLTLVRDGAWGCDEINAFFDSHLRPRLGGAARGGLFAGAPVLITRNDASRGLFNGDVGITLRDQAGRLRVAFQRQEGVVSFPAESLPAHELGFALTVHKSQGSEYANVLVVVPPRAGKRLLTKELVYTAITRAKTSAILCGTKDVLKFAIGRKIVRESALDWGV